MSAFLCSKVHVAALVRFQLSTPGNSVNAPAVAATLYAQNVRSVNHRYPQQPAALPETFTLAEIERAPALEPVEALKLAASLEYQSCETPDWEETTACDLLQNIRRAAIRALPGYDAAPWRIADAHDLASHRR